jgi:2'-5' RNA ligase
MQEEHLHISIRAVGFQVIEKRGDDELLREDVGAIAERASRIVARARPSRAAVGPVNVFPDALILEVHDDAALASVRAALAEAVGADAFGLDDGQYLPHITIAWFERTDVAAALRARLPSLRAEAEGVETLVRRIDLARWWFTGIDDAPEPELDVVRSYAMRGSG